MEHLSFLLVLVASTIAIVLILFFAKKNNSVNTNLIEKLRNENQSLRNSFTMTHQSYLVQIEINSKITNELKEVRTELTIRKNMQKFNDKYINEIRNELSLLHNENQLLKSKKKIVSKKEVKIPGCNLILQSIELNKEIKTFMVKYPNYPAFRIKLTDEFAFNNYFIDSFDVMCLSVLELAIISSDVISYIRNNGTKLQKERLIIS